jgi:hypothetical protein
VNVAMGGTRGEVQSYVGLNMAAIAASVSWFQRALACVAGEL